MASQVRGAVNQLRCVADQPGARGLCQQRGEVLLGSAISE